MVDRALILQKLQQLTTYLAELEPIARFPFAQYLENYFTRYTAERLLQLIVDTAADINAHLLVDRTNIPPKDYRESIAEALAQYPVYARSIMEFVEAQAE